MLTAACLRIAAQKCGVFYAIRAALIRWIRAYSTALADVDCTHGVLALGRWLTRAPSQLCDSSRTSVCPSHVSRLTSQLSRLTSVPDLPGLSRDFDCFDFILGWDGMSGMEVGFDSLIFFGRFDCLILLLSTNLGSHRQTMPV